MNTLNKKKHAFSQKRGKKQGKLNNNETLNVSLKSTIDMSMGLRWSFTGRLRKK